jgi:hypothetical protein
MRHFEVEDGVRPIPDARCTFVTFWIFNCLFIRVFGIRFSGFPPVDGFRPGALEPFVLGTFKRFRCPFGSPFSGDSTPIFRAVYFSGVPLSSGFLGDDFRVPPRGQTRLNLCFPEKGQKIDQKMVTKFHQLLAPNRPISHATIPQLRRPPSSTKIGLRLPCHRK